MNEAVEVCGGGYGDVRMDTEEATLRRAANRLSDTYVVRLTAETESLLYFHQRRFPSGALGRITIDERTSAVDLVNLAATYPKLGSVYRIGRRVHREAWTVFDYRNVVAHGGKTASLSLTFGESLRRLAEFVRRLEDASDV